MGEIVFFYTHKMDGSFISVRQVFAEAETNTGTQCIMLQEGLPMQWVINYKHVTCLYYIDIPIIVHDNICNI